MMSLNVLPRPRRMLILAEGKFGHMTSKTANAMVRYRAEEVIGVIDSTKAGKIVQEVIQCGGAIPIVSSLDEGLQYNPNILLIGIAPGGGQLPDEWIPVLLATLDSGLHIISGLHTILSELPELSNIASEKNVKIIDLRKIPAAYEVVSRGLWERRKAKTILTVGTDCNIGKMTVTLELQRELLKRNRNAVFVATGQTGIILSGRGIAVDSVISDFIAGSIEKEIEDSIESNTEYVLVEGQGSLTHQGYSGVTLGLLHGTMPDAMIMCHMAGRNIDQDYNRPLVAMRELIMLHERLVSYFKPSKVIGIGLNTVGMTEDEALAYMRRMENETGLPAADPYRFGGGLLADAIEEYFRNSKNE
jgi:uncharacterized NAD-dependent epimerase/dehydratase family protein